jgi:hypothetical protein
MSDTFIKLIRSQKADWLQENHPNAFLLLCLIAKRARRYSDHMDGLEIGDAHIGDYAKAGIETEMKYRTAKKILIDLKIIKIKQTCRKRKNATTKTTTEMATYGTLVTLIDSSIYDINHEGSSDLNNDRNNDRATTEQRPSNDEQERIRKNKKEERKEKIYKKENPPPIEKIAFRSLVTLTQDQYDSLLKIHPKEDVEWMLDYLDSKKGSNGYVYISDYHVLGKGGWVFEKLNEEKKRKINENAGKPAGKLNEPEDRESRFKGKNVLRFTGNSGDEVR